MERLFRQFSFPGGIPSHAAPDTPGSINEGGELGYSLLHAYGAAFDNPGLIAACVIGDGEAETGALAASWHSNKFLNPERDGAVLPILHLNGYKIANPTVLARVPRSELEACSRATATSRILSRATIRRSMHQKMAATLDRVLDEIAAIQDEARGGGVIGAAALADDRAADAEGLDRPERSGRLAGRRHLALASGAARRPGGKSGAPAAARRMDAQLPARRSCSTRTAPRSPRCARCRRRATGGWA